MIFPLALTIAAGAFAWALAAPPPHPVLQNLKSPISGVWMVVRPMASHAYAEGAPPGFTGGFTEQSCDACHFLAAPNAGPGKLTIDGVPDRFVASEAYRITIGLTQTGMKLAGFQLAARFKDNGEQAGTFVKESDTDARVGVETQSGVQFAGQRREGATLMTPNEARWTVMWTAPSATRTVVFHVAANGANGDERADGDYVYTLTRETGGSKVPEFQRSRVMP